MYTSGVRTCTPVVYARVHQWCTHVYTSGVRTCTPVVYARVHQWCTHVYTSGVRTCTPVVYARVHQWCTHVYTSGVRTCTLVVYAHGVHRRTCEVQCRTHTWLSSPATCYCHPCVCKLSPRVGGVATRNTTGEGCGFRMQGGGE